MKKKLRFKTLTYHRLLNDVCEEENISNEKFFNLIEYDYTKDTTRIPFDLINGMRKNISKNEYLDEDEMIFLKTMTAGLEDNVEKLDCVLFDMDRSYKSLFGLFMRVLEDNNIDIRTVSNRIDDDTWKAFQRKRKIENIINED